MLYFISEKKASLTNIFHTRIFESEIFISLISNYLEVLEEVCIKNSGSHNWPSEIAIQSKILSSNIPKLTKTKKLEIRSQNAK